MSKIVLDEVTSGYNLSLINNNFDKIESLLNDKVLYRQVASGEANTLDQNLDCNGKTLYNVGQLRTNLLAINGEVVVPNESFVTPIPPVIGNDGKILYTDGEIPYWADYSEIAYGNRTLGDKLNDFINASDYNTLAEALDTGKSVKLDGDVTLSTTESQAVLPRLHKVFADNIATINLAAGVHVTTSGNIAEIGVNEHINIVGATPVDSIVTNVVSVSGSSGAYNVRLTLASTAGMAVGNYLKLDNMVPLATLSGDNSVFRARVAQNELLNCSALLGNFTCATGGNTASWSSVSGSLSDIIQNGDLITQKGQTREVVSVGASSVTISGTWELGATATRAYYVSRPNTGTISTGGIASQTINGTSTLFLTEANQGDLLLVNGVMVPITTVTDNLTITVGTPVTITPGTKYSIITAGFAHEGTHLITSVIGNDVIVTNKWRGPYKPPVNRVSGGNAKCIRTVLKNNGTGDGFSFRQNSSLNWANNFVLVGDNLTADSHGLALDGRSPEGPTQIGTVSLFNAGEGFSVVNWGRGAFLGNGCVMQTRKSHFCGNLNFGIWALEGAVANIRECVVSGTNGRGVQLNANSTLLFTEGHAIGNASDGVSCEAGSSIYSEIPIFSHNGGMGLRLNGAMGFHVNEGIGVVNQASGVFTSAASNGEMSRMLLCGNARENMEITEGANIIANEVYSTGAMGTTGSGYGVYCYESQIILNDCAITGNKGNPAYFFGAKTSVDAVKAFIKGTSGGGVSVNNMSRLVLSNGKIEMITLTVAATVMVDGVSPVPTLVGVNRLNEYSSKGSIAKNDSSTDGVGFEILKVNGGSGVKKLLTALSTLSFGTVPAGGEVTQTISVPGAITADLALISVSNSTTLTPTGILLDAAVLTNGAVTVRAQNFTAGGIAVPSLSVRATVIGF